MIILIAGLAVFLGVHSLRIVGARQPLVDLMGTGAFKLYYALISVAGLAMILYGYVIAGQTQNIWTPPPWTRWPALVSVPLAFTLILAAYIPSHIGKLAAHPMTLAVWLWSGAHLIAVGQVRPILIFGAFFLWASAAFVSAIVRGEGRERRASLLGDLAAIVLGCALAGLAAYFHMQLFGVAVIEFASEARLPSIP